MIELNYAEELALIEKVRGGDNNTDNGSSAFARAEADYKFLMLKGAQK